jgi:hypothetical protein
MKSWACVVVGLLGLILVLNPGLTGADEKAEKTRNPFGVPDVPDPDGKDVKDHAAKVKLAGDAKDANAEQWVKEVTTGKTDALDGEWYGRWNGYGGGDWVMGIGTTQIKTAGDRVYILFKDHQGRFLIEAVRDKNRLTGRWKGLDNPSDTGPCVFVIVDGERIDGDWGGAGRWDFRRKLKAEKGTGEKGKPDPKEEALLKKASVDGKYAKLLKKLEVADDKDGYGEFNDWGLWTGTAYRGYGDLPPGYWVYVAPHWYIWGEKK